MEDVTDGVCDGVCDGVWLFGKDSFEECPLTNGFQGTLNLQDKLVAYATCQYILEKIPEFLVFDFGGVRECSHELSMWFSISHLSVRGLLYF